MPDPSGSWSSSGLQGLLGPACPRRRRWPGRAPSRCAGRSAPPGWTRAQASHQVPKGRTGLGREGVSGVTEIMEVKSAELGLLQRRRPDTGEVRASELGTLGPDEDVSELTLLGVRPMCLRRSGSRITGMLTMRLPASNLGGLMVTKAAARRGAAPAVPNKLAASEPRRYQRASAPQLRIMLMRHRLGMGTAPVNNAVRDAVEGLVINARTLEVHQTPQIREQLP